MIYLLPLLSVILGYVVALLLKPKNKKSLKLLLAFSGAFLLSLTVMHLLPEVYESATPLEEIHQHEVHDYSDAHSHNHDIHEHHDHDRDHDHEHSEDIHAGHAHNHANNPIGLFIMAGIVFQIILEYFSKGAEHGHVHGGHDHSNKMPWLLFISLCLHALLEGMPVSQHNDMAWGIAIHHFPIAIILTAFFINSGLNKIAIMLFMLAFAAMTPLGTILSEQLHFISHYYTEISAIVVGILFHISSTIIFESSEGHKFNLAKLLVIILGVIMAYFL